MWSRDSPPRSKGHKALRVGGESFTTSRDSQRRTIAWIWSTLWCRLTSFVITSRANPESPLG